jgi:hypothetical protein
LVDFFRFVRYYPSIEGEKLAGYYPAQLTKPDAYCGKFAAERANEGERAIDGRIIYNKGSPQVCGEPLLCIIRQVQSPCLIL